MSTLPPNLTNSGTAYSKGGSGGEVGGRFDFDDGGTYCGGWQEGKAHGHGVCTGPKGQGEYAGSWHYGFEVSGIYTWPSGSSYEGHWQNGKRHGLGVEARGRWVYRGEWTQGLKGRYGVRQSAVSSAKYEGTWANGLQDGYGSEMYADGGTYQGQWLRGMRHGYGVRSSAPFGIASHCKQMSDDRHASLSSLTYEGDSANSPIPNNNTGNDNRDDADIRGGFVLRAKSDNFPQRRRSLVERTGMKTFVQGLKLKKQRSTGDLDRKVGLSIRSTGSTTSWMSADYPGGLPGTGASVISEGSNQSFMLEDEMLDSAITETYMGEWKNDKRCGFGVSERSDGLKYEGEWYNNRKYGYGVTTQKDGTLEEGKYKSNVLITSNQKRHLFLIRSAKFRERIDSAINAAQRASKIALQKADIAISRTATARGKAEQADIASAHAREDGDSALLCAKDYSLQPDKSPMSEYSKQTISPFLSDVDRGTQQKTQAYNNLQVNVPIGNGGRKSPTPLPPASPHLLQPASPQPSFSQPSSPIPMLPNLQLKIPPNSMQQADSSLQFSPVPSEKTSTTPLIQSTVTSLINNIASPLVNCDTKPQDTYLGASRNSLKPQSPISSLNSSTIMPQERSYAPQERCYNPQDRSYGLQDKGYTSQEKNFSLQDRSLASRDHKNFTSQDREYGLNDKIYASHQDKSFGQSDRNFEPAASRQSRSFNRVMDDRLDHYKRTPSRQPSVEHMNMPSSLSEAAPTSHSFRSSSRASSRPPSRDTMRQRGPFGSTAQDIGGPPNPFKRTESLYFNDNPELSKPVSPIGTLRRKKSLPDVQQLDGAIQSQGSTQMTREEISQLSSSRRDNLRRQLEEIEKYKNNPLLYFLSPRFKEWVSQQQLILLILFINLTLAIVFFKILT